jgi:hypothetical protein
MQSTSDFGQEKRELQAVLDSGIFNRAPNLAHVLTYVCTQYFEGAAEQIKEYNIAVEALGRPAVFDQKRDSIVRVEAHRLRKRLREYYEADGADHTIRIEIPPGQYAPVFLPQLPPGQSLSQEALVAPADLNGGALQTLDQSVVKLNGYPQASVVAPLGASVVAPLAPPAPAERRPRLSPYVVVLAVVALLVSISAIALYASRKAAKVAVPPPVSLTPAGSQEIRILAGHTNGNYTDRAGRTWRSDGYFDGGTVFEAGNRPIAGTRDPQLYQSRREGTFTYDIPLPPGVYELRLYFAEMLYGENNMAGGGETSRLFDVFINGTRVLHELDVISDAGPSAADIRAFRDIAPAADGKLHLKFVPFSNPAFLNALEIIPGIPGRLRPIRMVSRDHAYTDKQGRVWEPDQYSRGGQLVLRTEPVANTGDPELFHGERFGNLKYVIPVPRGRYGVTLYFAEAWFGPGTPAGGGAGSRVFDILGNGIALRRNFDLFKEARGGARAFTLASHGLEPDAQGKLTISLTPVRNYACINAIEVVDESK